MGQQRTNPSCVPPASGGMLSCSLSPPGPEEEPPTLGSGGRGLPSLSLISVKGQAVVQARVGAEKAAPSRQRHPGSPWPPRGPGRLPQGPRRVPPPPPVHKQGQGGRLLPAALPGASGEALRTCQAASALCQVPGGDGGLSLDTVSQPPGWVVGPRTCLTAGHWPW